MSIRVLHIFAPSYQYRFGGSVIRWKHNFIKWHDPGIEHFVLNNKKVLPAKEAFNFIYPDVQRLISRWERVIWIFTLFSGIYKNRHLFDILHMHVLWWGGFMIGPWAKWNNCPAVYESVLEGADTPSAIAMGSLGRVKVLCLKAYHAILAISPSLADDFLEAGFFKEQVILIMNNVDTTFFSPIQTEKEKILVRKKLNLPSNGKICLFVGSLIKRKGIDILIQAFIESSKEISNLYLLLVGPQNKNENPTVDEELIADLLGQIDKNGIKGHLILKGFVQDRELLAELYQASDFFLFPSMREGLPNAVLEAMSTGLPVIVSRLPVLETVIQHQENGLFVPVDDADSLKKSILQLIDDPTLVRKLGTNARSTIEKHHSFQPWQEQLSRIYQDLLQPHKNKIS